jgi:hypothetical protein
MVFTRQQKQALAAVSTPLKDAGILQQVFTFMPGCCLFLGVVCEEWRAVYAYMKDQQVRSSLAGISNDNKVVNISSKTTLCSAAVASPATARLAWEWGLQTCFQRNVQLTVGLHADLETLTVLRELSMPLNETIVEGVALSGRLNNLQSLLADQQCPKSWLLSYHAARSGSIAMLTWLKEEDLCAFDEFTCEGAALAGQLVALQYLRSEHCDWDEDYIARYAARSGSIAVVEWLQQQQGILIDAEVLAWAASAGQTAMCKHLRTTGCDWNAGACSEAAAGGCLKTLRWLRHHGCPWVVRDVCSSAARSGRTNVLDYLMEQGEC